MAYNLQMLAHGMAQIAIRAGQLETGQLHGPAVASHIEVWATVPVMHRAGLDDDVNNDGGHCGLNLKMAGEAAAK